MFKLSFSDADQFRLYLQIANEIRLRDIGGIIVIDFIDMDDDG